MDLSTLNFKQILVILTTKEMRLDILNIASELELDINFKFVDSYIEAAKLIQAEIHDPYDHIIFNTNIRNRKTKDFNEFIGPIIEKNKTFLISYDVFCKAFESHLIG